MKTPSLLPFTLLAALAWPALCPADELSYLVISQGGSDGIHSSGNVTSSTLSSIGGTMSGAHGSSTALIRYGEIDLDLHAFGNGSSTTGRYSSSSDYWIDTFTINNAALTGQAGTARFTFHVDGNLTTTGNGAIDWTIALGSEVFQSITAVQLSSLATVTEDISFTFGTPIQLHLADVSMAAKTFTFPSVPSTADASISVRSGAMIVLSGGNAVDYTSSSNTGSARSTSVGNGGSYSSFTLANTSPFSHGSTVSLLDGSASAAETLNASFVAQRQGGATLVSDAVNFSGTGTDKFVLQISYDSASAIAQFGTEANLELLWFDPNALSWVNAVNGDSDAGATQQHFTGAYDSNTEFVLGDYGVDTVNHVVWAVIDHNSDFAVGQSVPEPGSAALLALGLGALAVRRRRRTQVSSR